MVSTSSVCRLSSRLTLVLVAPALRLSHRHLLQSHDYSYLHTALTVMLTDLDNSAALRRGRPKIQIDPNFLTFALEIRGPAGLASNIVTCAAKTIRRRALEYAFVQPGGPFIALNLTSLMLPLLRVRVGLAKLLNRRHALRKAGYVYTGKHKEKDAAAAVLLEPEHALL
ncbi:hypothetical protein SISNIDRAFT_470967 [Sistotremastrum niveocremeum HHB9708]|uniref:Uncharacterized protein n=1 Tax=Sistotremastrum niveocremeum HHB9708 TaxID=1314777 RepID=A0A164N6G3_9AGAM|nr:hypothetical protein SISNIDRAFT_470967 [Sistotremastrum niveocremeum HHB9708]